MCRNFVIYGSLFLMVGFACAQEEQTITYSRLEAMVPMRDSTRLYTVIYTPVVKRADGYPFIIWRTPYGAERLVAADSVIFPSRFRYLKNMAAEGYIFVYQDVRGKFRSEGIFQIHQPVIHETEPGSIDESTDTWDLIDWLLKNVPGNNGRAGLVGISYPGWLALAGAVDPHPALRAASEQACMSDLFLGDDFHHNGAFRLSYGFEYTYGTEFQKSQSNFPFPQYDLYEWYLELGPLKNVDAKYFQGRIPTWKNFTEHPDYDEFWTRNSPLSYVHGAQVPMLHVGGYYDQEDILGPQLMYREQEKSDTSDNNFLVLGPWNHGQWSDSTDRLGRIIFGSYTTEWFKAYQKKWFDHWLKGKGEAPGSAGNEVPFKEAWCFQTGSNEWKSYDRWPPEKAVVQKLYLLKNARCSFDKPAGKEDYASFISDPEKPVPYRSLPIEATYGKGSRWDTWLVEDQRFVFTRPDVLSFTGEELAADLAVTGDIVAHLFASTSDSDADWVVKLIDVYPAFDPVDRTMSQYQFPVAMEIFRGRYRRSFSDPTPLEPGKPEEFIIDLHQINHVFKKGHRLMVQVQSTWFPVIDRNPQKFVENIFEADESDFIKAEHRVYFSEKWPSHIDLPVMKPESGPEK